MFVRTGVLMVLCLTTGIPNLSAFPTPSLQSSQISPKQHPSSLNDDPEVREFQNFFTLNSKRLMSDVFRSFLSPENMKSTLGLVQTPAFHSTNEEESVDPPSHTRQLRYVNQQDEIYNAAETAKSEGNKASSPLPYIPGYSSDGSSSSSSSQSSSNPLYGGYAPGLPNAGQGDATLVIGGFNILLVPMPGVSASNMGSMFQSGQQLSQLAPGNPFANSKAAI